MYQQRQYLSAEASTQTRLCGSKKDSRQRAEPVVVAVAVVVGVSLPAEQLGPIQLRGKYTLRRAASASFGMHQRRHSTAQQRGKEPD